MTTVRPLAAAVLAAAVLAAAGLHYTAFVSETVDGAYAAAADSVLADGETRSFAIPTGDSPALFVKIVASDHAFSAGDALPAGEQ